MKESSKVLIGLGLGLVAGGIAGYFLASEEGQKFQRKTKKQLKQLEKDMKLTLKENSEVVTQKLDSAATTAKSWANEVSETLKNKISSTSDAAEDVVEDAKDDFQHGVQKAKKNIQDKAKLVNEVVEKENS